MKNKNSTKWWDGATSTWSSVFQQNLATLASPGAGSTGWTFNVPMPSTGGVFYAQAEAVDGDGQSDVSVAKVNFTVLGTGNPPETSISSPVFKQIFTFPGGVRQSFPITISGTATDPTGTNRGVAKVYIFVKNREHGEYYCGQAGCAGGSGLEPDVPQARGHPGEPGRRQHDVELHLPDLRPPALVFRGGLGAGPERGDRSDTRDGATLLRPGPRGPDVLLDAPETFDRWRDAAVSGRIAVSFRENRPTRRCR